MKLYNVTLTFEVVVACEDDENITESALWAFDADHDLVGSSKKEITSLQDLPEGSSETDVPEGTTLTIGEILSQYEP
jgi:hypothetical protein